MSSPIRGDLLNSDCATHAVAIVPADSDLAQSVLALYIGSTGDVTLTTLDGDVVTFVGVPTGAILPVATKRVAAATTAASIVGLW